MFDGNARIMVGDGDSARLFIVWSDELSVGNAAMDDDHRRFITLVNELNEAIAEGGSKPRVLRCLQLIVQDAKAHFEHEQALLFESGYPRRHRHATLHTELLNEIVGIMVHVRNAKSGAAFAEKGLRIGRLLVEHLLSEDMRYRDWLHSRG